MGWGYLDDAAVAAVAGAHKAKKWAGKSKAAKVADDVVDDVAKSGLGKKVLRGGRAAAGFGIRKVPHAGALALGAGVGHKLGSGQWGVPANDDWKEVHAREKYARDSKAPFDEAMARAKARSAQRQVEEMSPLARAAQLAAGPAGPSLAQQQAMAARRDAALDSRFRSEADAYIQSQIIPLQQGMKRNLAQAEGNIDLSGRTLSHYQSQNAKLRGEAAGMTKNMVAASRQDAKTNAATSLANAQNINQLMGSGVDKRTMANAGGMIKDQSAANAKGIGLDMRMARQAGAAEGNLRSDMASAMNQQGNEYALQSRRAADADNRDLQAQVLAAKQMRGSIVSQLRQQHSEGQISSAKDMADLKLKEAQTAKVQAEAGEAASPTTSPAMKKMGMEWGEFLRKAPIDSETGAPGATLAAQYGMKEEFDPQKNFDGYVNAFSESTGYSPDDIKAFLEAQGIKFDPDALEPVKPIKSPF